MGQRAGRKEQSAERKGQSVTSKSGGFAERIAQKQEPRNLHKTGRKTKRLRSSGGFRYALCPMRSADSLGSLRSALPFKVF